MPGRASSARPWWLELELADIRESEASWASAVASTPPEPEPWMLQEWELLDDPRSRRVRAPSLDESFVDLVAEGCDDGGDDCDGGEGTDGFPLPEAVVAGLQDEAADFLVARIERLDREGAARSAELAATLAALVQCLGGASEDPFRRLDAPTLASGEVSAALRVSARSAKAMVHEALELTRGAWAPVLEAMSAGRIPHRRVRTILDAAVPVPAQNLAAFAAEAAALAGPSRSDGTLDTDSLPSPGALGRRLRRLAEKHAAEPLAARKAAALERRKVDIEPAGDGMCWLTAYLPLEAAAAIDTRLEAIARSLASPREGRTVAQRRADVFADLLTDGVPESGPATGTRTEVIVTIPARMLAGTVPTTGSTEGGVREARGSGEQARDDVAEVLGYGPIDADTARLLAARASTWTCMWVDPASGAPLAVGRRRYTPTAAMRRFLGARDCTCRFPGCDKPGAAAEADHTRDWSTGGPTSTDNLALLCPEHHRLKTLGYWTAKQVGRGGEPPRRDPATTTAGLGVGAGACVGVAATRGARGEPPGTIEWTSPTGRRYLTRPEADSPPPF
ncbi:HNH endonuclease signature motif containing protein [Sinomonas flava]|uniref:HNH endonuclease signature motif containing protein n=1 Tax=Sinomonas flava TaxID=496857 RepID=A0ABP5NUJ6_9MICC